MQLYVAISIYKIAFLKQDENNIRLLRMQYHSSFVEDLHHLKSQS